MKFYDLARPLYLETDASIISLGTGLLQLKDGMSCGHDEVPDNAVLWPITYTRKSLSSLEWHYSNIKCMALRILHA